MPDMSLSRAFTTRRVRMSNELAEASKAPARSSTTKHHGGVRNKISGPVHLVHTTNMLSYNAPDIPRAGRSNSTSNNSNRSDEESDIHTPADSTPPTSPETSPYDNCHPPEPNHLSSYFMAPPKPPVSSSSPEPPAIPKRSPSHTKKNSLDAVARQRSVSQMSRDSDRTLSTKASMTFSRSSSTSTRASSTSHVSTPHMAKEAPPPVPAVTPALISNPSPVIPDSHPFGKELAQVTELAEEYGMRSTLHVIDEEQHYIESRGLLRFSADDYLNDVHELFATFIQDVKVPMRPIRAENPLWI